MAISLNTPLAYDWTSVLLKSHVYYYIEFKNQKRPCSWSYQPNDDSWQFISSLKSIFDSHLLMLELF